MLYDEIRLQTGTSPTGTTCMHNYQYIEKTVSTSTQRMSGPRKYF